MKENEIEEKIFAKVMRSDVFTEDFPVQLNAEELAEAAHKLAGYLQSKAEVEQQKKDTNSRFNGQISVLETAIEELYQVINEGEHRPVECVWEFNWETGDKVLVRLDTDEEIKVGRITHEDRQMHMVLDPGGEEEDRISLEEEEVLG